MRSTRPAAAPPAFCGPNPPGFAATPRPRDLYVLWHMNAGGNALMAKLIAGALGDRGK